MPVLQEKSPKDIGRALLKALKEEHRDAANYFLTARNIDVRAFLDADMYTALHYAVEKNYPDIVQIVMERGANCNAQDKNGLTALHVAAKKGHAECVKLLLDKGAAINIKTTKFFLTPLHFAALTGNVEILKMLLDAGADVQSQDKDGCALLHYAAKSDHVEVVQVLLEKLAGVSPNQGVNARAKNNYTPLHFAVAQGNKEIVALLLESGADPCATDDKGFTVLHIAAKMGLPEITRALLLKGADANSADKDGKRPQDGARHPLVLADLQHFGANIEGFTPPAEYVPPDVSFSERQVQVKEFAQFEKFFDE